MIQRITLTRSGLAGLLLAGMPYAGALAVPTTVQTATATPVVSVSPAATAQNQHLTNLKARGSAEIDRRLANLVAAKTKLDATSKLTAADKTVLVKQLTDETTSLTALKAKLSAETVLANARADVSSIITDYRVYTLVLPKVRLITAYDGYKDAESKLIALQIKLQTQIETKKAAGKDVTTAQAKMTDLLAQLKTAQSAGDDIGAKLLALQPVDYNTNHAVLINYRTSLKQLRLLLRLLEMMQKP